MAKTGRKKTMTRSHRISWTLRYRS